MAVLVPHETTKSWPVDEIVVTEPPVIRRAIGAAAIGNVTEWYDFGVYAYFEPGGGTGLSGVSDAAPGARARRRPRRRPRAAW